VAKAKTVRKTASKKTAAKKKRGASTKRKKPAAYKNLAEVRRKIDDLDDVIVPLLCERHHTVTRAAPFKPSVKGVVIVSRVEQIISRVRRAAKTLGTNPDAIEAVYRTMIDAFTKDEQRRWKEINK
jgi:isochorismate pyruvate lyase